MKRRFKFCHILPYFGNRKNGPIVKQDLHERFLQLCLHLASDLQTYRVHTLKRGITRLLRIKGNATIGPIKKQDLNDRDGASL